MPPAERHKPLHEQVHDALAADIAEGVLRHGDRVPSAAELAAAYGTSRATASRALAWLASDGIAETRHNGTFVKAGRLKPGPQRLLARIASPASGSTRVLAAEYVPRAPRYIWPLLGLEDSPRGDGLCPVVRREELHCEEDGTPWMLSVDWVPPRFIEPCPALLGTGPLPPGGAAGLVEDCTGVGVVRGRLGVEARPPLDDGREGPLLQLGDGEAVLAAVWLWFSVADAVVYTEAVLPEGRVLEAEWDHVPG